MKQHKQIAWLPAIVFLLSMLVLNLYRQLYATAVDGKGLLIARHPLSMGLWAAVFVGALLIVLTVWKLGGSSVYEDNFVPSTPALLGHLYMGLTVVLMALLYPFSMSGVLAHVWKVLGILSGMAMIWGGICRKQGKMPFYGIHAGLCAFLLLYLISRYQGWSGNPQLEDYVFELLALSGLVLFSYQCAAFESGMGSRRMHLAAGLFVLLLWGPASFRGQVPGLYFGGAFWAVTNLCRLIPPQKKDEVDAHDPA